MLLSRNKICFKFISNAESYDNLMKIEIKGNHTHARVCVTRPIIYF